MLTEERPGASSLAFRQRASPEDLWRRGWSGFSLFRSEPVIEGEEEASPQAHAVTVVDSVTDQTRHGRVHRGAILPQYVPGYLINTLLAD